MRITFPRLATVTRTTIMRITFLHYATVNKDHYYANHNSAPRYSYKNHDYANHISTLCYSYMDHYYANHISAPRYSYKNHDYANHISALHYNYKDHDYADFIFHCACDKLESTCQMNAVGFKFTDINHQYTKYSRNNATNKVETETSSFCKTDTISTLRVTRIQFILH